MRQIPRTARSVHGLSIADCEILNIFLRASDKVGTSLSFIWAGVRLSLDFNAGSSKKNKGSIAEVLYTLFSHRMLFSIKTRIVNYLSRKKELTVPMTTKPKKDCFSYATHYEVTDHGDGNAIARIVRLCCPSVAHLRLKTKNFSSSFKFSHLLHPP